MLTKIERIKQNEDAIISAIKGLENVTYHTVSTSLPRRLAEGSLKLDHSVYNPADFNTVMPNGIGRYLIYDHTDTSNPFSIWVFAFAPRQKTTIHDHKYKGTVTVLEGPRSEKYYQPTGEHTARLVERVNRYRFHSNHDDLNGVFVHQLKRRKVLGAGVSVTLHIYNMEAYLVNFQGEKTDQRNLNIIYSKDKTIDKENIPPYSDAYPERTCGM